MAKLKAIPHQAIIDGLRGKVDFYVYHPTCDPENRGSGVAVARKWPRSPGRDRAPAVEAQWPIFTAAARGWLLLPSEVQDSYRRMAVNSGLSGRDLFTRSYITGLYRYEIPGEGEEMIAYPARAYKSAAPQTIAHGVDTIVTFDVKDYDPNNCFDLPNNKYVVPIAGYYLFIAQVRWSTPVADKVYSIGPQKNGTWHAFRNYHSAVNQKFCPSVSGIIKCEYEDELTLVVTQGSGGPDDIAPDTYNTYIEITRLS